MCYQHGMLERARNPQNNRHGDERKVRELGLGYSLWAINGARDICSIRHSEGTVIASNWQPGPRNPQKGWIEEFMQEATTFEKENS